MHIYIFSYVYTKILFGDHPLTLERYREDFKISILKQTIIFSMTGTVCHDDSIYR